MNTQPAAPSQRRLQRAPDFTGERLTRFSEIFARHGLPVAVLGLLLLLVPQCRAPLSDALQPFLAAPGLWVLGLIAIGCALIGHAWILDRRLDAARIGWILYLLAVSLWEEWVFRVAVPYGGQQAGMHLATLIIASNLAFGLMHYFTLRWKWQWCLGAAIGGLLLSRNFDTHFHFAVIVTLHWVATYLNTPRPPGQGRSAAREETADDYA